jgi:hypothetical protein
VRNDRIERRDLERPFFEGQRSTIRFTEREVFATPRQLSRLLDQRPARIDACRRSNARPATEHARQRSSAATHVEDARAGGKPELRKESPAHGLLRGGRSTRLENTAETFLCGAIEVIEVGPNVRHRAAPFFAVELADGAHPHPMHISSLYWGTAAQRAREIRRRADARRPSGPRTPGGNLPCGSAPGA